MAENEENELDIETELKGFVEQAIMDLEMIARTNEFEWDPWSSPANTIKWGRKLITKLDMMSHRN